MTCIYLEGSIRDPQDIITISALLIIIIVQQNPFNCIPIEFPLEGISEGYPHQIKPCRLLFCTGFDNKRSTTCLRET